MMNTTNKREILKGLLSGDQEDIIKQAKDYLFEYQFDLYNLNHLSFVILLLSLSDKEYLDTLNKYGVGKDISFHALIVQNTPQGLNDYFKQIENSLSAEISFSDFIKENKVNDIPTNEELKKTTAKYKIKMQDKDVKKLVYYNSVKALILEERQRRKSISKSRK